MAERTVIEARRSVILPDGVDPVAVAAAMNPAMSSWVALRRRIDFEAGQSVLVIGATGNAGRVAIQVAKRFGAARVIAAGRNRERLAELGALGADEVCTLDGLAAAADVDVVIDYLWGATAEHGLVDMLTARADRGRPLTWIQIGSITGATAAIPSAALRSARLSIVGSGVGSVPGRDYIAELPAIAEAASAGAFDVRTRTVPLRDVESAWTEPLASDERIVFTP
ncbi:zinc-binding dehydrogenase [Tsukamurella soli]